MRRNDLTAALAATALCLTASSASAFCGFYVGGADTGLTNNATMVVMMREGTTTVLSMQNDYEGPPEGFALVVPVPVVLDEEHVRTLPRNLFGRVDRLASPRLVEYWEQDPCATPPVPRPMRLRRTAGARSRNNEGATSAPDLGVTVEAQFEVGEYEIVILSATDSGGLETWLQREEYNIPDGASVVLRPYIESSTKFFVARVNPDRVTFENGRALLSPLRVHYEAETFSLPVRLGLLNSPGMQDLIVHVLARNQRYELANYENVTIPTNLDVADAVRERFGEFYARLFDVTVERNPGAVVTEYAWQATNCDPCPGPVLSAQDLMTLGADVALPPPAERANDGRDRRFGSPRVSPRPGRRRRGRRRPSLGRPSSALMGFVLTRLHYRYDAEGLDEDLVFRTAPPIVGGREFMMGDALEHGARQSSANNFQGRYAIRHPWEGPIACENPIRGRWGGPPQAGSIVTGSGATRAAQNTAFAPRGNMALPPMLRTDAPEIEIEAGLTSVAELLTGASTAAAQTREDTTEAETVQDQSVESGTVQAEEPPPTSGCGACAIGAGGTAPPLYVLALASLVAIARRRR